MSDKLLEISDLKVHFHTEHGVVRAVDGTSMDIRGGETLGVVGESGSGKSVTAMSIMQLLPAEAAIRHEGRIAFMGRDVIGLPNEEMRHLRGSGIGMIFQEPMTSLNPVFTVGHQVAEAILAHEKVSRAEARNRTIELFREVDIPNPEQRVDSYPHHMSGGQKQRVMIAMALSCNPRLLIADEPTTALDVTIQAQILDLIRKLRDERGMAIMFITHDLGVIAEIADRVAVMFQGHLVEYAEVLDLFQQPRHPYTRSLLACRPTLETKYRRLPTTSTFMDWKLSPEHELVITEKPVDQDALSELETTGRPKMLEVTGDPLLDVQDLRVHFPIRRGLMSRVVDQVRAVDGISFQVWKGQTLGLVGESGCGKTTTGRALLRLIESGPTAEVSGRWTFGGEDVKNAGRREMKALRARMQIIFQDPFASLNPRMTVAESIMEPLQTFHPAMNRASLRERAVELMEDCGLQAMHLNRYPHEFSGGQRQRISIARALAVDPEFIVCDESVSALDVSVQAQVLNLLKDLQEKRDLTYVFISHDLSVVKFFSDTMAVMKDGKIVEYGAADEIYAAPREDYTRRLIQAIPDDRIENIARRQRERLVAQGLT